MSSVWDDLELDLDPRRTPRRLVEEMVKGLEEKTHGTVGCRLQNVSMFIEELPSKRELKELEQCGAFDDDPPSQDLEAVGYDQSYNAKQKEYRTRVLLVALQGDPLELEIFRFKFTYDLYPVLVYFEWEAYPDLACDGVNGSRAHVSCASEEEFKELLRDILRSKATREAIVMIKSLSAA